ncbi:MAG: LamG domain-containing protein [Saprospiraceae bacterium]|nr:LamG domain-containing protein [Saprospiraceae bacterium]
MDYNPLMNLTSFSVEAWIKTSQANGDWQQIVVKHSLGGNQNYSLNINQGKAHLRFDTPEPFPDLTFFVESTTLINDDVWHHLVGTFDQSAGLMKCMLTECLKTWCQRMETRRKFPMEISGLGRLSIREICNRIFKGVLTKSAFGTTPAPKPKSSLP